MNHRFTIGVEEEFQIVDPTSCELRSHVSELMAASAELGEQVKPEMHQSIIEIGTKICQNVDELDVDMRRTRGELVRAAESRGLQVAAAGTHPFSSWIDQVISPGERYQNIVEEMGQLARSLLIFGMHVHVAVPDTHHHDRSDEYGALFSAAFARAFHQLAFLDGPRYWPEIFSHHGVSAVSRGPAFRITGFVEPVRGLRRTVDPAALHR